LHKSLSSCEVRENMNRREGETEGRREELASLLDKKN